MPLCTVVIVPLSTWIQTLQQPSFFVCVFVSVVACTFFVGYLLQRMSILRDNGVCLMACVDEKLNNYIPVLQQSCN
jgi:hypothetical protein